VATQGLESNHIKNKEKRIIVTQISHFDLDLNFISLF
jgi:hypothetical protein